MNLDSNTPAQGKKLNLQVIKALFSTLILLILAPLFFTLFLLPIQLYRNCLRIWVALRKPEFGGIVSKTSAIMGADDLYGCPSMTIVVCNIFEGKLEPETIKQVMIKSVLSAKSESGQEYKFPQLRQSLARWGGYYFWKMERDFEINHHISTLSSSSPLDSVDEIKLHDIFLGLLQKPFMEGRPLWEVSIVPNVVRDGSQVSNTAVFLRMHHILGDGYSIMNMIQNGLLDSVKINASDDHSTPTPSLSTIARSISQRMLVFVVYPFRYMYEQVTTREAYRDTVRANTGTRREVKGSTEELSPKLENKKRLLLVHVSKSVSIHKIRAVKTHFDVTFTSILLSAMARSFGKILPKTYTAPYIASHVVMPTPHHRDDLSNEMSSGTVYLPLGEMDDVSHLKWCHREYESEKRSTTPLGSIILMNLIGGLPLPLYENGKHGQAVVKACISNFPGPPTARHLNGVELLDCFFSGGLYPGLDLEVSVLSYKDSVKFAVLADGCAISKDQLEFFTNSLAKHCNQLHEIMSSNDHQQEERVLGQNSKWKLP